MDACLYSFLTACVCLPAIIHSCLRLPACLYSFLPAFACLYSFRYFLYVCMSVCLSALLRFLLLLFFCSFIVVVVLICLNLFVVAVVVVFTFYQFALVFALSFVSLLQVHSRDSFVCLIEYLPVVSSLCWMWWCRWCSMCGGVMPSFVCNNIIVNHFLTRTSFCYCFVS